MRENGVVLNNDGNVVKVQMQPSESCDGCNACFVDKSKLQILQIRQQVSVQPGDQVEIEVRSGFALRSAFLLFFLPLVMLVCGYLIFQNYPEIPGLNSVYQGILGGILLMGLTYWGVHLYDRHLKNKNESQIRILKRTAAE